MKNLTDAKHLRYDNKINFPINTRCSVDRIEAGMY